MKYFLFMLIALVFNFGCKSETKQSSTKDTPAASGPNTLEGKTDTGSSFQVIVDPVTYKATATLKVELERSLQPLFATRATGNIDGTYDNLFSDHKGKIYILLIEGQTTRWLLEGSNSDQDLEDLVGYGALLPVTKGAERFVVALEPGFEKAIIDAKSGKSGRLKNTETSPEEGGVSFKTYTDTVSTVKVKMQQGKAVAAEIVEFKAAAN